MKTKIFAYKGALGAETDMEKGKFINKPLDDGQLGCVICVTEIEITQEAVNLLKSASREGGSFGPIMLTKHGGEIAKTSPASIGLMGFGKHLFMSEQVALGKSCDKEILDLCTIVEIEVPEEFKKIVDNK
jgi:hypothetical protein